MNKNIFIKTLPKNTLKLVQMFTKTKPDFLQDFYLSGGTALSLQIGHRESEDLGFFSQKPFNPELLQQDLIKYGQLTQTELDKGTLNTFIDGVKLQFLEYPYALVKPTIDWESIQLSSIEDIACTKLQTIGTRGSKKDFIDLYYLLKIYTLNELFAFMDTKYGEIDYNKVHIMKSLVYFQDAELQPMPRMHKTTPWNNVKEEIIKTVKTYEFDEG